MIFRARSHRSYFNPRSPCEERRPTGQDHYRRDPISIHAPRVRSDGWDEDLGNREVLLQSTLPV